MGLPVFSVLQSGGIDWCREVCDATSALKEGRFSGIFTLSHENQKGTLDSLGAKGDLTTVVLTSQGRRDDEGDGPR